MCSHVGWWSVDDQTLSCVDQAWTTHAMLNTTDMILQVAKPMLRSYNQFRINDGKATCLQLRQKFQDIQDPPFSVSGGPARGDGKVCTEYRTLRNLI